MVIVVTKDKFSPFGQGKQNKKKLAIWKEQKVGLKKKYSSKKIDNSR